MNNTLKHSASMLTGQLAAQRVTQLADQRVAQLADQRVAQLAAQRVAQLPAVLAAALAALFAAAFCAALVFPSVALAAPEQGNQAASEREYLLLNCIDNKTSYSEFETAGRYLLLCDDGTGLFVPGLEVYQISDWNTTSDSFTATTTLGQTIEGTIDENYVLTIEWDGNTLEFQSVDDLPPIMSLSPDTWYQSLPYVLDEAGLLTADQLSALEARAQELSQKYACDVRLVVVGDMRDYSDWGELGYIDVFAEEVAQGYNLGYGENRDMLVLVMSMAGRDFSLISYGPFGKEEVFTKYAREKVVDGFKPAFKENNWYQGFNDYFDTAEKVLSRNEAGIPLARPAAPLHIIVSILFSLVIAFVIAYIVSAAIRSKNKSVMALRSAGEYAVPNGSEITYRNDRFVRTTESRVYSPESEKDDSRSSSYDSGSGFGHTSGKF